MNGYQIVNESVNVTESSLLGAAIGIGAAFGMWTLNKHIRTSKVLAAYPTPAAMKAKLLTSKNPAIVAVADELNDDMNPVAYKAWVEMKVNPKMGIGKAILFFLFGGLAGIIQIGKALVHSGESGDTIVGRAAEKGRLFTHDGNF